MITLVFASAGLVGAILLLIGALSEGRTAPMILLSVALGLASLLAAAWAVGRIRRIRALTPEAISGPPSETDLRVD